MVRSFDWVLSEKNSARMEAAERYSDEDFQAALNEDVLAVAHAVNRWHSNLAAQAHLVIESCQNAINRENEHRTVKEQCSIVPVFETSPGFRTFRLTWTKAWRRHDSGAAHYRRLKAKFANHYSAAQLRAASPEWAFHYIEAAENELRRIRLEAKALIQFRTAFEKAVKENGASRQLRATAMGAQVPKVPVIEPAGPSSFDTDSKYVYNHVWAWTLKNRDRAEACKNHSFESLQQGIDADAEILCRAVNRWLMNLAAQSVKWSQLYMDNISAENRDRPNNERCTYVPSVKLMLSKASASLHVYWVKTYRDIHSGFLNSIHIASRYRLRYSISQFDRYAPEWALTYIEDTENQFESIRREYESFRDMRRALALLLKETSQHRLATSEVLGIEPAPLPQLRRPSSLD